jgi:hypothetical protein
MQGTPSAYLDVAEYERIRNTDEKPESWCIAVEGYWVQVVPAIVYELEYRGLLDDDETMSTYVIWDLTQKASSGKL